MAGAASRPLVRKTEIIGTIGTAIARKTARRPRIARQLRRQRSRSRIRGVRMAAVKEKPSGKAIGMELGSLVIVAGAAIGRRERGNRPEIGPRNRVVAQKEGRIALRSSRITYVEVSGHMLVWHTTDGEYRASGSLGEAEEALRGEPFAYCNRCYYVNLRYVSAVRQYDVWVDGERLQISRLKRTQFMTALGDYLAAGD